MLEGWRHATVEEICQRVSVGIVIKPSQYYVENGEGIRAFRSTNIGENKVFDRDWVYLSMAGHEANKKSALREGDVLVVRSGAPGTACVVPKEFAGSNCIDVVFARPDSSQVLPEYLASYTNSEVGKQHVLGNKGGLALQHFNVGAYKEMVVLLPPLPEQRKIAEILRTWDEALDKLTVLRAARQDRFTGLTQQIMGRGGVFPQQWPLKALSAVSTPVRRKSAGDNHPVMTISAKSGFLMQSDKFARDMAGQSVERYTLLHQGEFAYNKGNSKTAPYGCVFRLDRPTALVPFVYYCFALKSGLDPEFYEHLFAAGALNHQLSRLINSGVRNDGLLNLYSEDFYSCQVPVPPIDEQRKIARALTAAKQELVLIDDEIEALTRQKRGLMQKLLTGEWRVKPEAPVA
jgi:type I restriction enzyme S subunit